MKHVDADKFCEALKSMASVQPPLKQSTLLGVVSTIENYPAADVVPRSEVDLYRKQVDELEDELASVYDKLENAKADVAREIFEEIETVLKTRVRRCVNEDGVITPLQDTCWTIEIDDYAQIKKKYTEGK